MFFLARLPVSRAYKPDFFWDSTKEKVFLDLDESWGERPIFYMCPKGGDTQNHVLLCF